MLAYGSQDSRLCNVLPGSIHITILTKKKFFGLRIILKKCPLYTLQRLI